MQEPLKHRGHDVVIVGGGVIGLAIARSLALRGVRDVCLIERSSLGTESSFAAAGMLAPQAEADSRDDLFKLLTQSRDLYQNFAAELRDETGIDIELDTTGTLYLALTDHDQSDIEARFAWQSQAQLPVEKLTPEEATYIEPCISADVRGALLFPGDIQVENRRLLSALANSVAQLNIHLLTGVSVDSLDIRHGRVAGVQTSAGSVSCSTVIVAAGAWSSFIDSKIKVEPVRGQMICLTAQPQLTRHVIYSPRGYLVPRQDGRLLAGSTGELVGFTKEVTAGGVATILKNAVEISPSISNLPIADTWAGLRPRAADGLPVLGPCGEISGLVYATGHYRNGILLTPITAELIAKTIVDNVVPTALAPFSPDRFAAVTS
ncbi:MAG TPA: glycine oxidase ThiO [Pyrinomonadaceae bacterium]